MAWAEDPSLVEIQVEVDTTKQKVNENNGAIHYVTDLAEENKVKNKSLKDDVDIYVKPLAETTKVLSLNNKTKHEAFKQDVDTNLKPKAEATKVRSLDNKTKHEALKLDVDTYVRPMAEATKALSEGTKAEQELIKADINGYMRPLLVATDGLSKHNKTKVDAVEKKSNDNEANITKGNTKNDEQDGKLVEMVERAVIDRGDIVKNKNDVLSAMQKASNNSTEIKNSKDGIAANTAAINAEGMARGDGDAALQDKLNAEELARITADDVLQAAINAIPEGAPGATGAEGQKGDKGDQGDPGVCESCNGSFPPEIIHDAPFTSSNFEENITFTLSDDVELSHYIIQGDASQFIQLTSYFKPAVTDSTFTHTLGLHSGLNEILIVAVNVDGIAAKELIEIELIQEPVTACEGIVGGVDNDLDGSCSIESGGGDCNDDNPDVHPGANFQSNSDNIVGFDWNCDGIEEQAYWEPSPTLAEIEDATPYVSYFPNASTPETCEVDFGITIGDNPTCGELYVDSGSIACTIVWLPNGVYQSNWNVTAYPQKCR